MANEPFHPIKIVGADTPNVGTPGNDGTAGGALPPSAARRRDDANVFLVTVDGDVPDDEQSRLRLRGLYHGGQIGMSRTGDIRAGTCETSFAVLAATAAAARAHAERELRPVGRRIIRVEQAS